MANQPKPPGFSLARRIAAAKTHEFALITKFLLGYRNREDITNLPQGVLIKGSQNVLTDVTGRVQVTKGYTLDGQSENGIFGFLVQETDFYLLQEDSFKLRL